MKNGQSVEENLVSMIAKIGEKITIGRVKTIKNSTSVPHGVAISNDSRYAFISVEGKGGEPGIVDVIDLKSLKLVDKVEVGKQAGGIAFWKKEI